ncbi:MAG: hypothetical protein ACE5H5_04745 [Nitrospinota bacterium]
MGVREVRLVLLAGAVAMSVVLAAGCATDAGRGTVGGLVYGSMVGTTIAPGIGSAIGAGVGMLAGAFEGSQIEKEEKARKEAYQQAFYRLREDAEKGASTHPGAPSLSPGAQPSGQLGNLRALQEDQPLVSLLEREVHKPGLPEPASRPEVAKLYQELAALRRERRELDSRVGRLTALLEEYDRSGRNSQPLLAQMEEALGLPHGEETASTSGRDSIELRYLQKEYEIALRLQNAPLAEAVARRYERLSGRRPLKRSPPPLPSLPSGF